MLDPDYSFLDSCDWFLMNFYKEGMIWPNAGLRMKCAMRRQSTSEMAAAMMKKDKKTVW